VLAETAGRAYYEDVLRKNLFPSAAVLILAVLLAVESAIAGSNPYGSLEERKARYLATIPDEASGAYGSVGLFASGRDIRLAQVQPDLDKIDAREDCAEFSAAAFLRLLFLDAETPRLSPDIRQAITETLLHFKYWIDEPGRDGMCTWSENHQIMFHSCEYLAGTLFPDKIFPNSGMSGKEHKEKARDLLDQC